VAALFEADGEDADGFSLEEMLSPDDDANNSDSSDEGPLSRVIQNAKSVRHKPLVFGIMFQYRQGPLSIFWGFLG